MKNKFFYENKPEHWRHAGWLPLLVAGVIVGVLFTIGMSYSIGWRKEKKAAEQAAVDAKNGVVRLATEGVGALKLLEVKSAMGLDEAVIGTVKKVKATDSSLEVTFTIGNKLKTPLKHLNFSLIDIKQNGQTINAVDNAQAASDVPTETIETKGILPEKSALFSHAIGEGRQFLLIIKFTTLESNQEKSLAVPFQLR
jgi:hypothetical protein